MSVSQIIFTAKRVMFSVVACSVLFFAPVPYVFAEGADSSASSSDTSCNPSVAAPTGIRKPTGADAVTYTYDECTGLWENPYYTWNPATQHAAPKTPQLYTCDTSTWKWGTTTWIYSPASGSFKPVAFAYNTLPAGAQVADGSVNPCAPAPIIATTGPSSTNTISGNGQSDTTINDTTNASLQNTIGSSSTSGNAVVLGNTTGGNAATGNATAMANIINTLQSSSVLADPNLVTFVANINGDVQGDLIVNPSALQPASGAPLSGTSNATFNNQATGTITNNINLAAQTGDATVADNTTGGNATSGNAAAIADVVNTINSVVQAGKSFIGVINVNGNINGNILVPQGFLDTLLATNAPTTTLSLSPAEAQSLGITNNTNLGTTNSITSTATTGNATTSGNTNAGSATTGNAKTDVRVFNLTGNQVIAANSMLVFVNVSGQWVGVIMNAPQGATAAAFGSGVSQNGIASDTNIMNNTNDAITNNIGVRAHSGDATVADNTNGGNATSGSANTAVNLLNMNNASFNLTGWFGILFINVFGNWYGNFGVYTPPAAPSSTGQQSNAATTQASTPAPTFRFVPTTTSTSSDEPVGATLASQLVKTGAVLGSNIVKVNGASKVSSKSVSAFQIIDFLLIGGGAAIFVIERIVSRRATVRVVTK